MKKKIIIYSQKQRSTKDLDRSTDRYVTHPRYYLLSDNCLQIIRPIDTNIRGSPRSNRILCGPSRPPGGHGILFFGRILCQHYV